MSAEAKSAEGEFRISGPVMMKVFEAVEQYRYELPEELRDTRRYCYVKTALGYLEIDVRSLVYLTARYVDPGALRASDGKLEVTEAVVETMLKVIQRIPKYLLNDLIGIGYEEFFCRHYEIAGEETRWPEVSKLLHDKNSKTRDIGFLQLLLVELGSGSLEIDDVRKSFSALFSRRGYLGEKSWKTFLKNSIRLKKKPGRPRKSEYDEIYRQRSENPQAASYGKLVRQILSSDPGSTAEKLNKAKAAVAYRKRKSRSSQ